MCAFAQILPLIAQGSNPDRDPISRHISHAATRRRGVCTHIAMGETRRALLAGGIAGAVEAVATMPFEVTKNRIQLGDGPRGVLSSMVHTYRSAGVGGFYYGLQATLVQVCGKSAIRFSAYERFAALGAPPFAAGTLAGLTEAVAWVAPTERLKVLRTSELGGAAGAGGASLPRAVARVLRAQGVAGLWVGAAPTAARQAVANGARFCLFERGQAALPEGTPARAALAGGLTGCASVLLTNPIDVLKTLVQATPVGGGGGGAPGAGVGGELARAAHAARRALREESALALLTRGVGARLLKIGLGQALIFGTYDAVRRRL